MKPHSDPEGYKKLLAYQKAAEIQEFNLSLTDLFPQSFAWLKEQMDKSGRSGTKNIIEGWKRNTTREYYDFLGYSIAAIEELKDDGFDIAKGLYKPLLGIMGLWKGINGNKGSKGLDPVSPFTPFLPLKLEQIRFYPLDTSLPPIVQLYLKCKEVLMLLNKLQESLEKKMIQEGTLSIKDKWRLRQQQEREADEWAKQFLNKIQRSNKEE